MIVRAFDVEAIRDVGVSTARRLSPTEPETV
jgi:hypothetical protein